MAAWLVYASRQGSDFGAMHVIYQFTEQYPFYMRLVIAGRRRRWGLDDVEPRGCAHAFSGTTVGARAGTPPTVDKTLAVNSSLECCT